MSPWWRDTARVMAHTAPRDRELARAAEISEDEMRAELEGDYAVWFGESDWAMEPFEPGSLAATAFTRGRLVRVIDSYGGPTLDGSGGGRRFACNASTSAGCALTGRRPDFVQVGGAVEARKVLTAARRVVLKKGKGG